MLKRRQEILRRPKALRIIDMQQGTRVSQKSDRNMGDKIKAGWNVLKRHGVMGMLLVICTVTFLSYANVLNSEFMFDDRYTIVENSFIKNLSNFIHSNWIDLLSTGSRAVTEFTFALNYRWGSLNVFGYHLVNILVHIGVVLIAFLFLRKTIRLACDKDENRSGSEPESTLLSLTVVAIFSLHPIQTQAVSYISQRAETLSALFYLISLMLFIRSIEAKGRIGKISLYAGGLFSLIVSWCSKVTAVSLPVSLLLYDYFFLKKRPLGKRLTDSGLLIISMAILGILFLISKGSSPYVGFSIETITPYHYFLTQARVIMTYIRLIIVPLSQNLDYNYPVLRSFFEPQVLLSFFFIASVIGLAIYLFFRSNIAIHNPGPSSPNSQIHGSPPPRITHGELRLISFGIFWFFIILFPSSSVIPQRDVIFEHRLYLASLGLILSIVIAGNMLLKRIVVNFRGKDRYIPTVVVIIIVSILAVATNIRNTVWHNDLTLWEDVVAKSPGKPRAHYNLGIAHLRRGHYEKALSELRKAKESKDDGSILREKILLNIGVTLLLTGRVDEAIDVFLEGLRFSPTEPYFLDNMAIALRKKGKHEEALKYADLSLKVNPENSEIHGLIGKIYYEQGNYGKALEYYTNALKLRSDDPFISWDIALTLEKMGKPDEASVYYRRSLSRGVR